MGSGGRRNINYGILTDAALAKSAGGMRGENAPAFVAANGGSRDAAERNSTGERRLGGNASPYL